MTFRVVFRVWVWFRLGVTFIEFESDLELSDELEADELELELLEPEPDSEPEESEPDSLDRDLLLDCLVCEAEDELTLLNLLFLSLESRSDGLREDAWPLSLLLDVLELVETGLAALRRSSLFRYKLEDLTDSMSAALEPRFGFEAEPGLGDRGASDFQLEFNAEDPWPRLLLPL